MQTMLFRVDPDSPLGLAEQIAGQIRGGLAEGRLSPGDRLPAARELASGLDVNMHTVLRAYSTLRDEGLIELRRGRGAQIRSDASIESAGLQEQIQALVESATQLGVTRDELLTRVREATA